MQAQLADKVARETDRSPEGAAVLRAMIDPAETLYASKEGDKVNVSRRKPAGSGHEFIVAVGEGEVLQLSYEQCVGLGVPQIDGGAEALGELFALKGWEAAGDYGKSIMERKAKLRRDRAEAKAAAFERKVERNLKRREETQAYVGKNLRQAMAWDPTAAAYETYKRRFHWGWGITRKIDTGELTDESQREWKTRTDACSHYLALAAKGLRSMKRLDKQAEKLGLEATYKPGEVDDMLKDIQKRLVDLAQHRQKETSG